MRRLRALAVLVLVALLAPVRSAYAIGWDSDDFLIGGGPSFTNKIGVFDHDFTFKGYLDDNFLTVAGMDFDQAGHLVAVGANAPGPQVRVYDSGGSMIGGFTRPDDLLGSAADLKVSPEGDYVIGTQNSAGAGRFKPDGTFVQQYGGGDIRAVAVVPQSRVWTSGIGAGVISVFDISSGAQTGTIALGDFSSVRSMTYSAWSNTVLVAAQGFVREFDLEGNALRTFASPGIPLISSTRGASGDVFATTGSAGVVLRWNTSGDFLGSFAMPANFGTSGIAWVGNAPEPDCAFLILGAVAFTRRPRRRAT
jgi:hypothetical protein